MLDVFYYCTSQYVVSVLLHRPILSPRALRSCSTISIKVLKNAIKRETAGENRPFLFYIRRNSGVWRHYITLASFMHLNNNLLTHVSFVFRAGHDAMVRARSSVSVAACYAVSNLAWCRIFREIACFPLLNIGTLFRCCILGRCT